MATPIAIFGAGGFGREVLQIILDINAQSPSQPLWEPVGFLADAAYAHSNLVHDLPILGSSTWLQQHADVHVVIAVGSPAAKRRIAAEMASTCGNPIPTLIHPRAWVGRNVTVGPGSIVCAGSLITTDIHIGKHTHVNIGSTIGHDAVLNDYVTLNPSVNISGNVTLSEGVEIGTGSIVIPHAHVGEWSIIGAGTVVNKPIGPNHTAVGVPARIIKTREPGWHKG